MKKFILFVTLLAAPAAHAADDAFSTVWRIPISDILNNYMEYDNKASADDVLNNYIEGFVAGLTATYNYGAGNGESITACLKVSGSSPTSLRKRLLKSAQDPELGTISFATYLYAVVHIDCDVVLGDYKTTEDRTGESS